MSQVLGDQDTLANFRDVFEFKPEVVERFDELKPERSDLGATRSTAE